MPGGPGRQGDMPQHNSAWTQSAQLAIGVMADLCPEPCIEFTESRHCLEPCLSEESRPAIEDDESDDAADAKKAAGETKKVLREDAADNGAGRPAARTELDTSALVRTTGWRSARSAIALRQGEGLQSLV